MSPTPYRYAGYYETWFEPWVADGAQSALANSPSYIGTIILSFMRPDTSYDGGDDLWGTGLQFYYDGAVLRQALAALRKRNPTVEVLVAVGGATYNNWEGLNAAAIGKFVGDYGLDGVDVNYEPAAPQCWYEDGHVVCDSDSMFIKTVTALSATLPAGSTLSVAVSNVGAYGEGQWANAQPVSQRNGMSLALLRSEAAGLITRLNIGAYDASNSYDPKQALAAYQSYFKGPILLGIAVPPEAWGDHVATVAEAQSLADEVKARNGGGMVIWTLQKKPNGIVGPTNPDAKLLSQTICDRLGLGDLTAPWPW